MFLYCNYMQQTRRRLRTYAYKHKGVHMFTHINTELWWHWNFSSLMINSWNLIRQPVSETWSHRVCVCVCPCGCHCVYMCVSPLLRCNYQWYCHRSLQLYAGSQRQASQERSSGSNWPERTCRETYVIKKHRARESENMWNMSSLHTERRQKHRHWSGAVYMQEPQVNNSEVHTMKVSEKESEHSGRWWFQC